MPFKYGAYPFGKDLYSLRPSVDFVASLSVVPTFTGAFTRMYSSLQGGFSFIMPLAGTLSASIGTFQAGLSFTLPMSGTLRETAGFRGDISVIPDFYGLLFRAAERQLEANLGVTVTFDGRLGLIEELAEASTLDVPILIGGGYGVYIGPFWDPDEPEEGFWVPDVPVDEFWVPNDPESVPNEPGLNYGISVYGGEHYGRLSPKIPLNIWKPISMERNYNG